MTTTQNGVSRRSMLQLVGAGALGAVALTTGSPLTGTAHAAQRIVPRKEWGFNGWVNGTPSALDHTALTDFIVHHHGPEGANVNGVAAPRKVHEIGKGGKDNGSGFRYSFLITQAGEIYEGRGFDLLSGATEGVNKQSISVQIHIHGDTKPSAAALRSLEWLYRETHRVAGPKFPAALKISGHQDHNSTSCPGKPLAAWVDGPGQALYQDVAKEHGGGQPAPGAPPYPGAEAFKVGQSNPAVKTLDEGLVKKGFTKHHDGNGYQPGTTFSEHTRLNVQDFQKAQGWTGTNADGFPGPETWKRLLG